MSSASPRLVMIPERLMVPDLLRAVAAELKDIVRDCHDLEAAIGDVFQILPQGDLLRRMQALDLIIQRASGLAEVTDRLADEVPNTGVSDRILACVSLSDMARRLSGSDVAPPVDTGDAEFW